MKIGIMSMQRIKNYGSFLQAYALKSTVESLGNEVEFIDYHVENCVEAEENKNQEKSNCFKKGISLIKLCLSNEKRKSRKMYKQSEVFFNNFEKFWKLLGMTEKYNYNSNVDALIIGSDEVFNCTQNNQEVGYSKELFGYNTNAKKVISYAASFGSTTMEKIKRYNLTKELKDMFTKFSAISVRDKNSLAIVKELIQKEPNYNLDPVLIYDFKNEITDNTVKIDNYIIVYAYSERITKEEQIKIKEFAKKHKKKLVTIGTVQPFCDIYIPDASPFELLEYFKKADYIITDTFHGSIYSIKYNKKFATIIRESNKQKLTDLLIRCDKNDRIVEDINSLEKILISDIDYKNTNEIVEKEKEKTYKYLMDNL